MPSTSDLRDRFGIQFVLLARRWRQALETHLPKHGLTDATWVPLIHLQETGGGITQKELAALAGIDGSSLVRLLDILTRQGLVERRVDQNDARARLVYLTDAGRTQVARIRADLIGLEKTLLEDLSDAELSQMIEGFERIRKRLSSLPPKDPS